MTLWRSIQERTGRKVEQVPPTKVARPLMPIPENSNVRSAIEEFQKIAAFAQAFQDARAAFDALLQEESTISQLDKEITSRRAELNQRRGTESTTVITEAETQRDSIIAAAREKAAEILKGARREHHVYATKMSAVEEKHAKLRRQIENIQASVNQLAR